jgi:hypothetical protein
MAGQYASLRKLPPELHAEATKLVAEVMASATLVALTERESVIAKLRNAAPGASMVEAFMDDASDFLDIRGNLVEWALPKE